jgi:gamma-glutamyltranspeptidase/glutathione hydrolase
VPVPTAGLIDPGYLAQRSALIAPDRSLVKAVAGTPPGAPRVVAGRHTVEAGTSHFVAVDRWGEVASITSTIESAFGSGLMVNGYYLNNELTDFSFVPDKDGCPVANRVEGGKRPRSSMSPTIVYGRDGKPLLSVGAAGGSTIPAQVIKTIIGVLDFRLGPQEAIALPMIYSPAGTVYVESGTSLEAMIPQLQALGHRDVRTQPPGTFKANAVELVDGRWVGGADPRSEGVAVSE